MFCGNVRKTLLPLFAFFLNVRYTTEYKDNFKQYQVVKMYIFYFLMRNFCAQFEI